MLTRYGEHGLTWLDMIAPTPEEVRSVAQEFDLDPLFAQELLVASYKPKVERRGDCIYVILHFPTLRSRISRRSEQEIDFLIGKNFLITTRYENIDPLHSFAKAFEVNSVLKRNSGHSHGGHLFVSMVRDLYQALVDESEVISNRLRDIEEHIFNGDEKRMVLELSHTGKIIHDFRQALVPHKEMLSSLDPVGSRLFGTEFSYYVRALEGSCARVSETLERQHDSMNELRETNNSLLSTKQNEIMKVLTIMAFVTFPLTLISSVFGMNTHYLPIVGAPGDFWIVIGMMFALALGFFSFFRHKGWL